MTDNSSAGAYLKHKDYLLVQVPDGSSSFIDNVFGYLRFRMYVNFKEIPHQQDIKLPEGRWQLIGLAAEVTEGQWREIVQDDYGVLPDFEHMGMIYQSAIHSAASLLRSHNINANQVVILKIFET